MSFSAYKGHRPYFVIHESVVPPRELTDAFGRLTKPLIAKMRNNKEESRTRATLRDTLLPKLLSAELVLKMSPERSKTLVSCQALFIALNLSDVIWAWAWRAAVTFI